MNYYQVNEKLFFEVDRQIEFELLSKSFGMACNFGASTISSVMVNEFHQSYCSYEGIKLDVAASVLSIEMAIDNGSVLTVA